MPLISCFVLLETGGHCLLKAHCQLSVYDHLLIHSFIHSALCSNLGINHPYIDQVQYWENGFSTISIQDWRAFTAAVGRVKVLMKSWLSNSWPYMTHTYSSMWSITDSSGIFFISSFWTLFFSLHVPTLVSFSSGSFHIPLQSSLFVHAIIQLSTLSF